MLRYLVALDGSPRAEMVLRMASALASKQGAELTLFRAVALPTELPPGALVQAPDRLAQDLEQNARVALETLAAKLGVRASIQVVIGQPWHAICEAAQGFDMVIIGSHGYGAWDRLLGTTAAKVVDHVNCSILVVKPTASER